jgi:hypothetical protein
MDEITTTNLEDFGWRELKMVRDLIDAVEKNGYPKDFELDEVTIMFNRNSGYVFLTNSDYQAAMLTDEGNLELWHFLPYSGQEGFAEDLKAWYEEQIENGEEVEEDDIEYMKSYGIIPDDEEEEE